MQAATHARLAAGRDPSEAACYDEFNTAVAALTREVRVLWGPPRAPFLAQARADMERLLQVAAQDLAYHVRGAAMGPVDADAFDVDGALREEPQDPVIVRALSKDSAGGLVDGEASVDAAPDGEEMLASLPSEKTGPAALAVSGKRRSTKGLKKSQKVSTAAAGGAGVVVAGPGPGPGQDSILLAAAAAQRSVAAQRARQEVADALLSCLTDAFLPALVRTSMMGRPPQLVSPVPVRVV
jgi:hypothetical protein